MPRRVRLIIAAIIAVIAGVVSAHFVPEPLPELSRAEFLAEVRAGHVRAVEIEDQDVILGESTTRGKFRSPFRKSEDTALPLELRGLGVEVRFTRSPLGLI